MFYKKFIELCNENGVTPSYVGNQIGVSKAAVSGWKSGSMPRDPQLVKIANYFSVPVSYFSEDTEKSPTSSAEIGDIMKIYDMLTPERKQKFLDSMTALLKEQLQG